MTTTYVKQKSTANPKPLMSIKEFAKLSGLEQSTLRYWDDIGLFRPAYRNTDNNYRYYKPDQIMLSNFIKALSNLNIPLKVIGKISENRTPEAILQLIERQETVLDTELHRLHEAYSTIHTLRDTIKHGISVPEPEHISVQNLDSLPIVLGPHNGNQEDKNFYQQYMQYCGYAKENRVNLNTPIGGYFESMERFLRTPSVPARFFSIDPKGHDRRAAGKYLVGYSRGFYGQMQNTPQRMDTFAQQHNLNLNGPVYVSYLLDEISMNDPSAYLAQVCAALGPAADKDASGW